jgi:hypothetical protein
MNSTSNTAEWLEARHCACPTCKLVRKIRRLLIASWFIVPAGGVGSLALIVYLAPPLVQLVRLQQPPAPAAPAPQTPPRVPDEPPDVPPKVLLGMGTRSHFEKVRMPYIKAYFGRFWRVDPKEDDISDLLDCLTSLPNGAVLYVDDHMCYSEDIKKVGNRYITIHRRDPRGLHRGEILLKMEEAITIFLSRETAERLKKLQQPREVNQLPF